MTLYSATLEVDLAALAANYQLLRKKHKAHNIAAVVKANGYGLGVKEVSKALWKEGCRSFCVATLEEGVDLRKILPKASITVFNGFDTRQKKIFAKCNLTPVLNTLEQVEHFAKGSGFRIQDSRIIHIDTGMTRLGLSADDLKNLPPRILNPESRILLMSHLACADEPTHPKNAEQLKRFRAAAKLFPNAKLSLANSAGLFLSPDFHFHLARPGCALYGINPVHGAPNRMQPVVRLSAPFLQLRTLAQEETVGYEALYKAPKGSRIAIVGLGYADGYMGSLSNKGTAYVAGHKVPVVGRVSMDMLALDVTIVPEAKLTAGTRAEFINREHTVDDVAREAGTIGYEIFTRLGARVKRVYS